MGRIRIMYQRYILTCSVGPAVVIYVPYFLLCLSISDWVIRVFSSPICPICFWSKLGFAENELIWLSILCTIVLLLNKHSSIHRFRTIRESTSFPSSPCLLTRTIAGEKRGNGRTLHLTWVANLVWIAIPWSLTGYSE